jgi:hypothetical protein
MNRITKTVLMLGALLACSLAFAMDANAAGVALHSIASHADIFGSMGGDLSMLGLAVGSVAGVGGAGNHATQSKFFRIAVEGATTDGRNIARDWITQMAKNYSPTLYGARLNLEHLRGTMPDGPFKAYGDVLSLEAREETGEFAGKLGLYAQIVPTPDLVAMTKAKQKIYTSCEIDPSFADTKQAYLVGLAVTDSPASLGTSILSFAAQNPKDSPFAHRKLKADNLFTAAVDEVVIELEEVAAPAPSVFKKVGELIGLFKSKGAADDSRFADMSQAVEALATFSSEQAAIATNQQQTVVQLTTQVGEMKAAAEKDRAAFAALKQELSTTGNGQPPRPAATGGAGTVATDC